MVQLPVHILHLLSLRLTQLPGSCCILSCVLLPSKLPLEVNHLHSSHIGSTCLQLPHTMSYMHMWIITG